MQFTIAEACQVLHPAISERRLRAVVGQLPGLRPCGVRRDGTPGRPAPLYEWADLARLHAALTPWLTDDAPDYPVVTAREGCD